MLMEDASESAPCEIVHHAENHVALTPVKLEDVAALPLSQVSDPDSKLHGFFAIGFFRCYSFYRLDKPRRG